MDTARIGTHEAPPAHVNGEARDEALGQGRDQPRPTYRQRRPRPTVAIPLPQQWDYFTADLLEVITNFRYHGGLGLLLASWTPEERGRAKDQLRDLIHQLEQINAQLPAEEPAADA